MEPNQHFEFQIERPAAPAAKRRRFMPMYIALFLAFTLLVGGAGGAVGYYMSENGEPEPLQQQQPDNTDPANTGKTPDKTAVPAAALPSAQGGSALSIQEIFEFGDRSTVAISTMTDSVNVFGQPVSQASAGSGFVLTADGYILTNHHVIDGASDIAVLLYDGSEYPAEIIGGDMKTDIAVLKIDAEGLIPVQIGDSDSLKVGDQVVGIGNPLGELANSLTVGHLSAKKRIISIDDTPRQMLQIVASVSPGNSGGPLFNISGQVIGVVSAKTVADGVEGIGFAIPINLAADIANELIQNGKVTGRPIFGISYQELTVLDNADDYPKGVYVAQVNPGSAAETAGLKDGDVITAFEGERITSGSGLLIAKDLCRVGDTVTVTVWRSGQEIDLLVTFTEEAEEVTEQPTNQNPYFNPWGR